MKNNTIVNIVIGASTLKIIHCEKQDTDIVIKNSVIMETGSNLYLNKNNINVGFIEDKLRLFFFENKIKSGKICYTLPDYMITTKVIGKQQIITSDYVTGLIKTKQLHELLDENIADEEELVFDCQILNEIKYNSKDDNDGATELIISYLHNSIPKALIKMSKRLKMTPVILEPETNGLLRLINMFELKDNHMIIDIGEIYTKIILINGTSSIDYRIFKEGVHTIDKLLGATYRCPPMIASQMRMSSGIVSNNKSVETAIKKVIEEVFIMPIVENLNELQNAYGSIQYCKNFLISGGFWAIPGLKDFIEEKSIATYDTKSKFQGFTQFIKNVKFDNDIVKDDIFQNIDMYASCLGLSLRGGI